tara:strand:+ start:4100 stop:4402 length:303 start_codon:yes stop_codon:yes gene_type:complete
MREDPDVVLLYIPLMKDLNMSWHDIKNCSRSELNGIIQAYSTYETMHSFDGYTSEAISQLAKNDKSIPSKYAKYKEVRARMEDRLGKKKETKSFKAQLGL